MRHACILAILLAARLAAAGAPKPVMAIAKHEWNFGTLEQGQTATQDIEVVNKGTADLRITFIRSSCAACVGNVSGARLLGPGQKGKIALSFYSKGLVGRQSKVVYVHSNDPATPYRAIRIVGSVRKGPRPELHVAADTLDVGLVRAGRPVVHTLTIGNRGQTPLHVLRITASEACRVKPPERSEIPPGGKADLRVTLLGNRVRGLIQEHLTLETSDPVTPSKSIAIVGYATATAAPGPGITIVPAGKPVAIPGTGKSLVRAWRVTNALPVGVVLLLHDANESRSLALAAGESHTIALPAGALDAGKPSAAQLALSLRIPATLPAK